MGSHAIDMAQPPGIGIRAIPGMDRHAWMVAAALAANISMQVPRKALSEAIRCGVLAMVGYLARVGPEKHNVGVTSVAGFPRLSSELGGVRVITLTPKP